MSCFTVNKFIDAVSSHKKNGGSSSSNSSPKSHKHSKQLQQRPVIEIVQEPQQQEHHLINELGQQQLQQHQNPKSSSPCHSNNTDRRSISSPIQSFVEICKSPKFGRKKTSSISTPSHIEFQEQTTNTLSRLQEEIYELSDRLRQVSGERDFYETTLNRMQLEKLRVIKERDDQLDSQSCRYEERLVELHSVIAELSRQLENQAKSKIDEENEDGENKTDNIRQTFNSCEEYEEEDDEEENEQEARTSELASRTSTDIIDAQAVEAGKHLLTESMTSRCTDFSYLRLNTKSSAVMAGRGLAAAASINSSTGSLQVMALQEELSDAKERNIQLTGRLQQRDQDLEQVRQRLEEISKENDILKKKNLVLEEEKDMILMSEVPPLGVSCDFDNSGGCAVEPMMRKAEMKRIRKIGPSRNDHHTAIEYDDSSNGREEVNISGMDFFNVQVTNGMIAQQLVQDIQKKSVTNEMTNFFNPDLMDSKIQEFEIEMERLSSKIEHLRSQNDVLHLTLQESKNSCDNLTVLIGKYESNYTAQGLTLNYNDRIVDALETLVALLETELGIVLANLKASGQDHLVKTDEGNEATNEDLIERANSNRRAAENVAKRLLGKLEFGFSPTSNSNGLRPDSGFASSGLANNSGPCRGGSVVTGAWDDSDSILSGSSGSEKDTFNKDISRAEESRLREFISQLKSAKTSIQSTIVADLESLHCDVEPLPTSVGEARTADLELAVLVQELMAMREERSDLRSQVFLMERDKNSMKLLINSQQAQEMALKSHIKQMQRDLENANSENMGKVNDDYHRKNRDEMRHRITELLQALEKVKRNSELSQQQQQEVINDLKRTNAALTQSLDRTRKKYQQKLKKLEQQILQSLMQKQFGKNFDLNSQSFHSGISTETDQTSD